MGPSWFGLKATLLKTQNASVMGKAHVSNLAMDFAPWRQSCCFPCTTSWPTCDQWVQSAPPASDCSKAFSLSPTEHGKYGESTSACLQVPTPGWGPCTRLWQRLIYRHPHRLWAHGQHFVCPLPNTMFGTLVEPINQVIKPNLWISQKEYKTEEF